MSKVEVVDKGGIYTHPKVPCPTFVNFSYLVTSGQNGKLLDVRDAISYHHAELHMRNLDFGHVFERGWAGEKMASKAPTHSVQVFGRKVGEIAGVKWW